MTNSALKGRADDPRACRGVIRATFLTFPMVIFLTLALSPLSANIDNSGNVSVQRCEAYADVTPTEFGYQFLEAVAGEAGLSVNDTVATITGITASSTGLVIANTTGIVFGTSGNRALENLAEAADYPDWSTLTAEQQTSWVTKENYDASKFNALLDAYGLDQDRDRFYSTGGQNFEFSQNAIDNIKRLGRIGNNWGSNIGVAFSDLVDAITNRNKIISWFPVSDSNNLVFDASSVENWPSGLPTRVNYAIGADPYGCYFQDGARIYSFKDMSSPVYGVLWIERNPGSPNTTIRLDAFSKSPFTLRSGWIEVGSNNSSYSEQQSNEYIYKGQTYHYVSKNNSLGYYIGSFGLEANEISNPASISYSYMYHILYSETQSGGASPEVEELPEYPEQEIPESTIIYYPSEGVNPTVDWPKYIEPQRPKSEYNPDDQTGTQEWKQETKQNVIPLQNIRFDKLFPFCLMTDVQDMTEKIEQTITPGQQSDYLKIKIPMAYASDGQGGYESEDVELDGTPLRDLLVMVRPFNQILLLFIMVFSLVMFWKSILTGD